MLCRLQSCPALPLNAAEDRPERTAPIAARSRRAPRDGHCASLGHVQSLQGSVSFRQFVTQPQLPSSNTETVLPTASAAFARK